MCVCVCVRVCVTCRVVPVCRNLLLFFFGYYPPLQSVDSSMVSKTFWNASYEFCTRPWPKSFVAPPHLINDFIYSSRLQLIAFPIQFVSNQIRRVSKQISSWCCMPWSSSILLINSSTSAATTSLSPAESLVISLKTTCSWLCRPPSGGLTCSHTVGLRMNELEVLFEQSAYCFTRLPTPIDLIILTTSSFPFPRNIQFFVAIKWLLHVIVSWRGTSLADIMLMEYTGMCE